jgi:hypothetical protein
MRSPGTRGSDFEEIDQTSRLTIRAPVQDAPSTPQPASPPPTVDERGEEGLWSRLDPAALASRASALLAPAGPERASEAEHGATARTSIVRSRAARPGAMALVGVVAAVAVVALLVAGFLGAGGPPRSRSAAVHRGAGTRAPTTSHDTGEAVKHPTKSRAAASRTVPTPRRRSVSRAIAKRPANARRSSRVRHTAAQKATVTAAPAPNGGSGTSSSAPVSSPSPPQSSTPPAQQTLTHTQSGPTGLGYEVGTSCDPTCR